MGTSLNAALRPRVITFMPLARSQVALPVHLLLNMWATWCAPCVAEMPTLNAVAKSMAGKVQVIAVSQDMQGAEKATPFFAARKFSKLKPYLDPKLGLSLAYQANLPTTILCDSASKEVWRMTGGYEWNRPAAAILIAEES